MSTSIVASGQAAGSGYRLDADSDTRPATAPLRQAEIHPSQTRPTQGHAGPGHTGPVRKRNRRRRWRLASLLLAVTLPTAVVGGYLYGYASDQYVTQFRVSVRHQLPLRIDPAGSAAPGDSLAGAGGSSAMLEMINDSQIVVQYLKSRQIVDDLAAAGVDLAAIYARNDADWLARMRPNASAEQQQLYWQRMVDPFFDQTTGIISVQVRAFSPADAQLVATKATAAAEQLMNDMSDRAHADMVAYADREATGYAARLKAAQLAMSTYRNQNDVLFPEMQATGDSLLEGHVEQDLIDAKAAYSVQLALGVSKDVTHMHILQDRIAALATQLQGVHGRLAKSATGTTANTSLASVMSGYRVLEVDEQVAVRVYERALDALQDARNAAAQQSVYLAEFVRPSLPQESMYPIRWRVMLETALIAFAAWCLLQLLYHGIRDHID
jgi:capsular polysaccharide transport system permease protein